jgi:hypothetical protein
MPYTVRVGAVFDVADNLSLRVACFPVLLRGDLGLVGDAFAGVGVVGVLVIIAVLLRRKDWKQEGKL